MTPFKDNPVHHSILEDNVNERLRQFQSLPTRSAYQNRILKTQNFRQNPLNIISQLNLNSNSPYYYAPDELAHILTLLNPQEHSIHLDKIRTLILIPEFIHNEKYLLSHVYNAQDAVLAMYLYPKRLNQPTRNQTHGFVQNHSRLDFPDDTPAYNVFLRVLQWISKTSNLDKLHSFLVPLKNLKNTELNDLGICHDLFEHSRRCISS